MQNRIYFYDFSLVTNSCALLDSINNFLNYYTPMSDPADLLKAELGIVSNTSEHHHPHHHHDKIIVPSAEATKVVTHKSHSEPDHGKDEDHKEQKQKHVDDDK
ncbi:unnamed protein product [Rotaria socialis]|uniref:Uncharacterized protein n=1 Tax=Rotaria socialis TaxID=392032 RepID=A0A820K8A6_9BILA|nr:unnamed protein product [Rotaria socialis]CAF3532590.1 unnamed protein product [Rotaria socialis]CAF3582231.1 unnamed protein product [Rotaria socialis]CAF3670719.1 unnamed protein product [Rotaria socialis]CAF4107899.1 unnamed protein product [Rotaria socialis]